MEYLNNEFENEEQKKEIEKNYFTFGIDEDDFSN